MGMICEIRKGERERKHHLKEITKASFSIVMVRSTQQSSCIGIGSTGSSSLYYTDRFVKVLPCSNTSNYPVKPRRT